jgi:beta-barrel assembly-enhancing protease
VGNFDQPVGLGSVLELWGDVLRDTDQFGLKLTRASPAEEMRLGAELRNGVLNSRLSRPEALPAVRAVGERMAAFVRRKEIAYRFTVIDSPDINAFSLPGGQVFVTTGMLGFVQSKDELAAVVGHEMAHVDLRHCIERYQFILKARKLRLEELGEAAQAARMLAAAEYSKYQEMDADAEGVRLAQAAGYDPRAAVRLFQRMMQQGGEQPEVFAKTTPRELQSAAARAVSDYFRSHPTSAERSARLNIILRP